ncbi:unnamed protein product [Paramecium sonneborni]|uniref:Uncharacterized protein n=1 Tax=Paramecium sonneborni TaxID=65129 RepID=A0A8S1K9H6_9CILI|nr:unnamed protein product [Paramecium sonneborni]
MLQIQIQTATQDKSAYNKNAQKIIEKLKANDVEFIDATLEQALQVFNSDEPSLRKLLLLRLIKDAIVIKSAKFINKFIQTRPLLTFIGNICTHKLGDSNPNRGADLFQGQDPQSNIEFLNLALELVEYLATTFPKDSKGAPTKFKIQYDELLQMGVKFPPQSSLILPFDPNKASQEPIQKQFSNQKEKDQTMLQLNQNKQTINQDIEMINETLVNDSDMVYINEVLATCCESLSIIEKSFINLINKVQQYDGLLNQDELAELLTLKDFVQKFQKYYFTYIENQCTPEAYNSLKKKTLAHIQKILNKDYDPLPLKSEKKQSKVQQNQQSQFANEDEMLKRAIEESKIQQNNSYLVSKQIEEQQKQEEFKRQQEEINRQQDEIKRQQDEIKRQQEEEKRQAKLREEQAALEKQIAEEQQRENQKKEQLKLDQFKQQEKMRLQAQQQYEQQQRQKETQDYWNNQFQTPNPDNQYITPTKLGSNLNSQQFQQHQQQNEVQSYKSSTFQQQHQNQQQKIENLTNEYIYSTVDQKKHQKQPVKQSNQFEQNQNSSQIPHQNNQYGGNTREQSSMNHINPNYVHNQKQYFDENFDGLSQSTQTQQFFPLKMDQQIPLKQHTGRIVKYDNTQFVLLDSYGLSESQKKRFKKATICGKAALFNSPQLQVGIKQALQYVPLKEKNYLKLTLYIGNKTQSNFDNCKILFDGDNKQFSMWLKPDKIQDRIESGQQIQQEVIGIFKQYQNYRLINAVFSAEWANKQISSQFFLTTTLVSFMFFKDISLQVFRTQWRQKKQQILRGETFLLNPKIVKTGHYLKKIFPKLCEFNSYEQFQDQQLDYFSDRQLKYISYKLCGIFELTNVNQNYMIKFIVLPNMQCTIQIIGNNEHLCKQMLNTLNWILGLE